MKKKTLVVLLVFAGIIGICWGAIYSMAGLPKGEFVCESVSPQGTYTAKLYVTNPVLSVGGTRGELVNNKTGRTRNIYWEYNRYLFEAKMAGEITGERIIWEDDDTIIIYGTRLNLPNDTYDWRRD